MKSHSLLPCLPKAWPKPNRGPFEFCEVNSPINDTDVSRRTSGIRRVFQIDLKVIFDPRFISMSPDFHSNSPKFECALGVVGKISRVSGGPRSGSVNRPWNRHWRDVRQLPSSVEPPKHFLDQNGIASPSLLLFFSVEPAAFFLCRPRFESSLPC